MDVIMFYCKFALERVSEIIVKISQYLMQLRQNNLVAYYVLTTLYVIMSDSVPKYCVASRKTSVLAPARCL